MSSLSILSHPLQVESACGIKRYQPDLDQQLVVSEAGKEYDRRPRSQLISFRGSGVALSLTHGAMQADNDFASYAYLARNLSGQRGGSLLAVLTIHMTTIDRFYLG